MPEDNVAVTGDCSCGVEVLYRVGDSIGVDRTQVRLLEVEIVEKRRIVFFFRVGTTWRD